MRRTSWLVAGMLIALIAVVVYSSFQIGGVRCEVCIQFQGREACRSVDGTTEAEALSAATTNACALLTSGVTNMLACERTPPRLAECRPQ
ncbi:MAG: hypothetical protein AB1671_02840 [Thermodesulfobacteriota bacterium]